ncbi:flagellar basal body rod protein FlgB [Roseateles saccharophilus]|uniref:Flagellar basal body rod protein FlgB n=1 Tax=Roseateles saccharophilus TaxID=304 RepID=A0A4R3VKI1_ROSSA|nr:flagellar basal body rod protein FlgB [Roseateles saccharophilus]MDG0831293.1 flagellar basal body rod protein FlgB [Roseateles saccharophilus]TCV04422.1 flagellar basal-body rod protein FlgB [Roseateles saccharophilus]
MINRLTDGMNFDAQALVLRAERQRLIASNIANADTPGYVARDLDFAEALRDATSGIASAGAAQAKAGDLSAQATAARVERHLVYAMPSQTNLDRNTVDMDRERAAFAENTIKYQSTLQFISGHAKMMLEIIKGTR